MTQDTRTTRKLRSSPSRPTAARKAPPGPRSASAKDLRLERLRGVQREAILDAAQDVFARSGFHAAKMSDIARQAGFSAGALYTYFPGKEAIFQTLVAERLRCLHERLTADLAGGGAFLELIGRLTGTYARFMDSRRSLFSILFSGGPGVVWGPATEIGDVVAEMLSRFSDFIEQVLQLGIREGLIRDLGPRSMAIIFMGMINSTIQLWLEHDPPQPFSEVIPAVLDLFLNGVKR
jgi:AcrR family transcriptional regulator